jgi:hypothetical protein
MDTDNYVCKCAFATLVSIIYVLHKIVFVCILCVFDHVRDKEEREEKLFCGPFIYHIHKK